VFFFFFSITKEFIVLANSQGKEDRTPL